MSDTAVLAVAPLLTVDRMNNPSWERPGRNLYLSRSLSFLPGRETVPLVIDHDMSRQAGVVHDLFEMDWHRRDVDLRSRHDYHAPCWLRRNEDQGVVWPLGYVFLVAESGHVCRAFVKKVSILPPGIEPREPLARVLSIRPTEPKPTGPRRGHPSRRGDAHPPRLRLASDPQLVGQRKDATQR